MKYKNESGITLIALVITVIVMAILTFTLIINFGQYGESVKKSNFTKDITLLNEEITQYYARNKELPIINKYTNTTSFESVKNPNDGADYYVIDLDKINVSLNYGKDYDNIKSMNINDVVTTVSDVYIINKQSHTVYYPKGIEINGNTYYKLEESFTAVSGNTNIQNPTLTAPTSIANLTYTGEPQELITAGSVVGGTLQYRVGNSEYSTSIPVATEAGTYDVYYKTEKEFGYYEVEETGPIYVTIGKATPSGTAPTAITGLLYNGSAQDLHTAGTDASGGTWKYKLSTEGDDAWSTTIRQGTATGTYTVNYKLFGDSNHNDLTSGNLTVTIENLVYLSFAYGTGGLAPETVRVNSEEESLANYIGRIVEPECFTADSFNNLTWYLFYDDDEYVFLISSEIPKNNLPTPLIPYYYNDSNTLAAFCSNNGFNDGIFDSNLSYKDGSHNTALLNNPLTERYLKWVSLYPDNTNIGIQITSFMMDDSKWSIFKDSRYSQSIAIGGPPIELYVKSFNAYPGHSSTMMGNYDTMIEGTNYNSNGYKIWSNRYSTWVNADNNDRNVRNRYLGRN